MQAMGAVGNFIFKEMNSQLATALICLLIFSSLRVIKASISEGGLSLDSRSADKVPKNQNWIF